MPDSTKDKPTKIVKDQMQRNEVASALVNLALEEIAAAVGPAFTAEAAAATSCALFDLWHASGAHFDVESGLAKGACTAHVVPGPNLPHPLDGNRIPQPSYWRNGAWLDMAEIVNQLGDRGFEVNGYDPNTTAHMTVSARLKEDRRYAVVIGVSREIHEPYSMRMFKEQGELIVGADMPVARDYALVRAHTTTARQLIRTVDAVLSGLRSAK